MLTGNDRVSLGEALHSLGTLDDEDLSDVTFRAVEWFERWLAGRSVDFRGAAQEAGGPPALRVWQKGDPQPHEVCRVTDPRGTVWELKLGGDWGRLEPGGNQFPWSSLLKLHGPLTEVLPEVPSGGDPDHG